MDKRPFSRKEQHMLLNALERAKEMSAKMKAKEEEKRWPAISLPLTLQEGLNLLTKDGLSAIRLNTKIAGASALKKQELIDVLKQFIPDALPMFLRQLDDTRFKILKQLAERGGHALIPLEPHQLSYFRDRGLVFSGIYEGKRTLAMPMEVLEHFNKLDMPAFRETIRRNTEWIKLTHGALFYYGVQSLVQLEALLISHTGETPRLRLYLEVMEEAKSYYRDIRLDANGFSSSRVINAGQVKQEHSSRAELAFYPFTKAQLLLAGEPDYVDRNPNHRAFVDFIARSYSMPRDEADRLVGECVIAIRNDKAPNELLQILETQLEMDSLETVQALMDHIVPLHNHTKQWSIKGYSPKELSAATNKPAGAPPPAARAKVIDLAVAAARAAGRNDPCPCGSGIKYKKCCGK